MEIMAQEFTSAYLVIQKGPLLGRRVEIWKERTTIGRSRDCDIFLEDITVHRKQASILRVATGYTLCDDHGKGDSYVNGQSVKEQQLKSGDQLLFGNTQLTFYANEGTRPFQLPSSRGRELFIGKTPNSQAIARFDLKNAHSDIQSVELLPRMTIGRSRDCNIFLEDLAVSRHHATLLELSSGEYELTDNRSATGTFVNGQAIVRTLLHEDDHIQIGATQFTFRISRS
jgi:pSer/pThr/pTyr-binding forkhead associated (FHA) protein